MRSWCFDQPIAYFLQFKRTNSTISLRSCQYYESDSFVEQVDENLPSLGKKKYQFWLLKALCLYKVILYFQPKTAEIGKNIKFW